MVQKESHVAVGVKTAVAVVGETAKRLVRRWAQELGVAGRWVEATVARWWVETTVAAAAER